MFNLPQVDLLVWTSTTDFQNILSSQTSCKCQHSRSGLTDAGPSSMLRSGLVRQPPPSSVSGRTYNPHFWGLGHIKTVQSLSVLRCATSEETGICEIPIALSKVSIYKRHPRRSKTHSIFLLEEFGGSHFAMRMALCPGVHATLMRGLTGKHHCQETRIGIVIWLLGIRTRQTSTSCHSANGRTTAPIILVAQDDGPSSGCRSNPMDSCCRSWDAYKPAHGC